MKIRYAGLVLVAFFLAADATSWATGMATDSQLSRVQAEDFTLPTARKQTVSLKDFRGKGVILFFFTTWCPYCREKFPVFIKEYQDLKAQGIELVAVDSGESEAKVVSFMEKMGVNFDIVLDVKGEVSGAYGLVGVPTFFLVDKNGLVVYEGNDLPSDYKERLKS